MTTLAAELGSISVYARHPHEALKRSLREEIARIRSVRHHVELHWFELSPDLQRVVRSFAEEMASSGNLSNTERIKLALRFVLDFIKNPGKFPGELFEFAIELGQFSSAVQALATDQDMRQRKLFAMALQEVGECETHSLADSVTLSPIDLRARAEGREPSITS